MARKAKQPCRIRPIACPECGYRAWGTRSWWERGLPTCPCGGILEPVKPADRAYAGLISQDDVPAPMWTAICRENGWEDLIVRKGAAAKTWSFRRDQLKPRHADHCEYPGCGKWVAHGLTHCPAHSNQLEAMPF